MGPTYFATGVADPRNVSTGEQAIEGDYLMNAQGEDVVAGIRQTEAHCGAESRDADDTAIRAICSKLEKHYREVQDVESLSNAARCGCCRLATLSARRWRRSASLVDLAEERLIRSRWRPCCAWRPRTWISLRHPQVLDPAGTIAAKARGDAIATGLNVSPGAASGVLAFDPDTAEAWGKVKRRMRIMVRPETKPDDVHGMLAAKAS